VRREDERLRELARDYHRPPSGGAPREELWARIAAERARRRAALRVLPLRPRIISGLAAAAVLILGIALGRLTAPRGGGGAGSLASQLADSGGGGGAGVAYQVAAAQYLTRTEGLLATFRAETRAGLPDAQFAAQARDLLTTTRLMLDSPAARDPHLRTLLEDLEVVLAQIAQLSPGRNRDDVDLINQGIDQRSVLLRLQTAVPAGPAARVQGAI
jgi:hypothetical protein